ncbi:MAG: zinc ABC transporter substrate-binding protein [Treponema sp.]|nr:zinc ABC transporter substrate-binding protein [Treponema sp.]
MTVNFVPLCLRVFVFCFIFASCSRTAPHDGILIAVSIPPQAWFVSQIAGDKASTVILVPPGQNPHNYEPTPRQIQSLASASAWILSGSEFEISLRPKIEALFPDLLIVDGTYGVEFRYLEEACDDHDHDVHDHSYMVIDRHTWLGRMPAIILANRINQTLYHLDPDNIDFYMERMVSTVQNIHDVFEELKITLTPLKGKSVFVYHPSFGYFLDEFGINQEAVETGGKEPTPRQLSLLVNRMRDEQPAAIFVQTQFPVNAAKTLAESVGAQVIELDPLAYEWLDNIRYMGQRILP